MSQELVKYITMAAFNHMGEPTVRPIHPGTMEKIATPVHPLIKQAAADLEQREDGIWVLVNALGAMEYWGSNTNGDAFPEEALKHACPMESCEREQDYGYRTFMKYAFPYRHHANKDPARSIGERVKIAVWNDEMKRIELIHFLRRETAYDPFGEVSKVGAADLIDRIEAGETPSVSMGCVTDPNYPVLTRSGYKAICDVSVGDMVYTHHGRWRKVTEVNRRVYSGKLRKFYLNGLPLPLEVTADHPMWAKVFEGSRHALAIQDKARRYFKDPKYFERTPSDWCHAEHIDVGDRFFYQPVEAPKDVAAIDSIPLAKIMGYFLAEGSFIYNKDKACTTQFSCHLDDDLPRVLPSLVTDLYPEITVKIRPHHNSTKGLSVEVHNTHFSEFLKKYVGRGAKRKVIPWEIFRADREIKLAFLGTWLNGDGWTDSKGIHWSSASANLLMQGRDLLASIGIPSSIYRIDHDKGGGYGGKGGIEYTLNVSSIESHHLADWSGKIDLESVVPPKRQKPSCMRVCPDGRYAYRIKGVEIREVENIQTYNFEVEEDESYLLAGLISHNCKVPYDICNQCHNKAKNTSFYCDHLKLAMNQVLPDGRTICAVNTLPKFFDISYVLKGADKTATVLQKLAGAKDALRSSGNKTFHMIADGMEKAASENREYVLPSACYAELVKEAQEAKVESKKNGAMNKEVPSNIQPEAKGENRVQRAANVVRLTDSALPDTVVKRMAGYPMGDILSTMTGMGMALKPHEAQKLIIIKIRTGKGQEDLGSPTVSPEHVRPSLASLLKEQMEGRSALREPLRQRVLKLLGQSGDSLQKKVAASDELTQGSLGDLADQTTRRGAKSAPVKQVSQAAVDVSTALVIKKAMVDPELAERLMARYLGCEPSTDSEKSAAVKTVAQGLTGRGKAALVGGALAAPYLYSGHVQQKARQGYRISGTESWLARNPGVTAVGSTLAALKGNKAIARKLWERQQRKLVPMAKRAEDHSGNSNASLYNNLDVVGTLRYGTIPELVDEAIIVGLCTVADRIGL